MLQVSYHIHFVTIWAIALVTNWKVEVYGRRKIMLYSTAEYEWESPEETINVFHLNTKWSTITGATRKITHKSVAAFPISVPADSGVSLLGASFWN